MHSYIAKRLLISLPVLLGVTLLAFLFINMAPGDPVLAFIDPLQRGSLGPEWVELRRRELGLDKPLPVRYAIWLRELGRGNLGYSLITREPVAKQIRERLWPTLLLMGTSLTVAVVLGTLLGFLAAIREYSLLDYAATVGAFIAISTPSFFVGLSLIYILAVHLRLLPVAGMYTLGVPPTFGDLLAHMAMPVAVLGWANSAQIVRHARSSMIEVIRQDYITTARAKGLAEHVVLMSHAFRNSLIPLITVVGFMLPLLLSGAVITEQIFQWPGMGMLTIRAVDSRDYPLLMGIILVTSALVLLSNLLADILYAVVDPRIRHG